MFTCCERVAACDGVHRMVQGIHPFPRTPVQQLATSARALCRSRAGIAPLHGPNWAPEYAQTQDILHPALHIRYDSAHGAMHRAGTALACKGMLTAMRQAAADC